MARILLIGGTSHSGKSTLAAKIAERMGCRHISTDSLARHPGRPWRRAPDLVPPHVVEHYRDLGAKALIESVLTHYNAMWEPLILPLVQGDRDLVLEGSALLPARAASVLSEDVRAIWLVASDDMIERRIKTDSGYASLPKDGQLLVDKFAERAVAFNRIILDEVERLSLPYFLTEEDGDTDDLPTWLVGA